MTSSIVIIAGGLATRLRPVTETIPKSMIEIGGKPFIAHQLELVKKNKLKNVVICASFLGEQIEDYIGDGSKYDLDAKFSFDGDTLLGTGGAIKNALWMLEDNFFVMYGDSYLNTDFQKINEYFFSNNKNGLMTVFKNENKWDKSNIVFEGGKIMKYDKKSQDPQMRYIDYGLGILSKQAFKNFTEDNFDLESVYKELLKKNELLGYEVTERFYEIGSFDGLEETKKQLSMNNV